MTVLILDDDASMRRLLQRTLDGETRAAATMNDGIEVAQRWQPSIIMLDVWLNEENAIESIPLLSAASPRAQIIVMTSDYQERDAKRALSLGAYGYVEKVSLNQLRVLALAARMKVRTSFHAGVSSRTH